MANNQPANLPESEQPGTPGTAHYKAFQDRVHRPQLFRPCQRKQYAEPVVFFKSTTAIVGPNDDLTIPRNSKKTDWEVELAVVIGKKASYVEENEANDYIAGYLLHNDYSEREFQLERMGQWVKGKSCDTFAPIGPWLVTTDEIKDIDNVRLWLTVNGKKMQDGNSKKPGF